jgi:hypothetical protein
MSSILTSSSLQVYKKETYDDVAKAALDAKAKRNPKEVKLSDSAKVAKAAKLQEEENLQAIAGAGTPCCFGAAIRSLAC